jgi:hypothetical protein
MSNFLSFKRTDPGATDFQRSEHLVPISSIIDFNQTSTSRVVINLNNAAAGFDTLTIEANAFNDAGFPFSPTWPAKTAPLADMIVDAITANPGGTKINVIPPTDANGNKVRISNITYLL